MARHYIIATLASARYHELRDVYYYAINMVSPASVDITMAEGRIWLARPWLLMETTCHYASHHNGEGHIISTGYY